jgi:ribosomal protein S5
MRWNAQYIADEVMNIAPVQKQTRAGQRTRFKAFVAVGDFDGHLGLGVKCAKEVATAIRGAIILAKLAVVPVRRGYWGAKLGEVRSLADVCAYDISHYTGSRILFPPRCVALQLNLPKVFEPAVGARQDGECHRQARSRAPRHRHRRRAGQ